MPETRIFQFDKTYYDRFYRDPATRVATKESVARLGKFVCAYIDYLGGRVKQVLDIGCGFGYWEPVIAEHFPASTYCGVEISEYLCRKYGWQRGSIVDFRSEYPFDLVICQGVLQYLDDEQARAALTNLAHLCHGFVYIEALTVRDWQTNCDQTVTDGGVYLREGGWYRELLTPNFRNLGGGLFLSRKSAVVLYEFEAHD